MVPRSGRSGWSIRGDQDFSRPPARRRRSWYLVVSTQHGSSRAPGRRRLRPLRKDASVIDSRPRDGTLMAVRFSLRGRPAGSAVSSCRRRSAQDASPRCRHVRRSASSISNQLRLLLRGFCRAVAAGARLAARSSLRYGTSSSSAQHERPSPPRFFVSSSQTLLGTLYRLTSSQHRVVKGRTAHAAIRHRPRRCCSRPRRSS